MTTGTISELPEVTDTGDSRFPSMASLRAAHGELLKRHRKEGNSAETIAALDDFIQRARNTGALLDSDTDRQAAQSLLDYWSTLLYRVDHEPPDATLAEFDPLLAPELDDSLNPYQGLYAFDEEDRDHFFGRRRLVETLLTHLKSNRLLAVVGPSGSGKSSLVRAGLVPALKLGLLEGSQGWSYLPPIVPGSNPLENLARLLLTEDVNEEDWIRDQVEAFKHDRTHLAKLVTEQFQKNTVFVIDQFEEIFTLCRHQSVCQVFVDNLVGLSQTPQGRHLVIMTMRTDFESQVARLPDFQPLFEQALVRVGPLSASELREVIESPAQAVGLKFEEGVVDALLNDILGEPAALPLLQFTLSMLWEGRERNRVTWEAYKRLGGGRQALAKSADEFYNNLIPEDQVTARRILMRLVRPGEGLEVTSNRVRRESLYAKGEAADRIERVLEKFVQARLLRLTKGTKPSDDQVEIAHEALVRNWPMLVAWLEEERIKIRERLRLIQAAEQWHSLGRDPSALLRGVLLQEATLYDDLNELETEFIRASQLAVEADEEARRLAQEQAIRAEMAVKVAGLERLRAEEQARAALGLRRRLNISRILLAATILLAAYAFYSSWRAISAERVAKEGRVAAVTAEANERSGRATAEVAQGLALEAQATAEAALMQAEEQSRLNEARRLAAQAENYRGTRSDLSMLLSLESYQTEPGAEAKSELLKGLYDNPRLITYLHSLSEFDVINWVAFSPDGKVLASASNIGRVQLWDVETLKPHSRPLYGNFNGISSLAFSPDGKIMATGSCIKVDNLECGQGEVRLWDLESHQPLEPVLHAHRSYVRDLVFSPDGDVLVSSGCGEVDKEGFCIRGEVILWNWISRRILSSLSDGHESEVWSVALSNDGGLLASGDDDGNILLHNISNPANPAQFEKLLAVHDNTIQNLAFSPDGKTLASGSADSSIKLWEISNPQSTVQIGRSLEGHTGSVYSVLFSPDGKIMASSGEDGNILLWSVSNPLNPSRIDELLPGNGGAPVFSVAFSPDGKTLASAGVSSSIILWDVIRPVAPVPQRPDKSLHNWTVWSIAYSPDGSKLATGSCASLDIENNCLLGEIRLWDADSYKQLGEPTQAGTGDIFSVAFDPEGKLLASGNKDGTIALWDVSDPDSIQLLASPDVAHRGIVRSVVFSLDGQTLFTAGDDGAILVWDISDPLSPDLVGDPINDHTDSVYALALSPDGRLLASGSRDNTIILWDVSDPKSPLPVGFPLGGHIAAVLTMAFSQDGKTLISGGCGGFDAENNCTQGEILLWDLSTGVQIGQSIFSPSTVRSLAFSPDGKTLALGNEDFSVQLWDASDPDAIQPLTAPLVSHSDWVYTLAFKPDGTALASAGLDRSLVVWDVTNSRSPIQHGSSLTGHSGEVNSVSFSPDGRTLASGSRDTSIVLWDISVPETPFPIDPPLTGHVGAVLSLSFSPDGKVLASGACAEFDSRDICVGGEFRLWDAGNRQSLGPPAPAHSDAVRSLAFSQDGKTLASGSDDGTMLLWDVSNPQSPSQVSDLIKGHDQAVNSLVFSPDGKTLASGSSDWQVSLWDIAKIRSAQAVLVPRTGGAQPSVPLRPQRDWFSSLQGHKGWVFGLAFSPDGKVLASAGCGRQVGDCVVGEILLWDVASQQQIGPILSSSKGTVLSLAYSPDGKTLASAGEDNSILLWDVSNPQSAVQLGIPLASHTGSIYSLAFSPDGKILASGGADRQIILWDVDFEAWQERACVIANRNLTDKEWGQHLSGRTYHPTCGLDNPMELYPAADAFAQTGAREEAEAAFKQAVQAALETMDIDLNNGICWYGSIDGFAEVVLPACVHAVRLADDAGVDFAPQIYDSRGLARALTGDYPGAVKDFVVFMEWARENSGLEDLAEKRAFWIEELSAGRNPFNQATLSGLRDE